MNENEVIVEDIEASTDVNSQDNTFESGIEINVTGDEETEVSTENVSYEENASDEQVEVDQPEVTPQEQEKEEGEETEVDQLRRELDELKAEKERAHFFEKFGSEEEYNSLVDWAGSNMPEDLIEGYNELISKENLSVDMQYALANLLRSHKQLQTQNNENKETNPRMLVGNQPQANKDSTPLVSVDDIEEAIANPLYGANTPEGIAYTRKVNARTGIGMSSL